MGWWEQGGDHVTAIALAIAAGAVCLFIGAWRSRRNSRPAPNVKPGTAELHAATLRLRCELEELAKSVTERLDGKMHALQELLGEATKVIQELRGLSRSAASSGRVPPTGVPAAPLRREPKPPHACDAPRTAIAAATKKPAPGRAPSPATARAERLARVYALADEGLDSSHIACETGLNRGEVDLILNLRGKSHRIDCGSRTEPARAAGAPEENLV